MKLYAERPVRLARQLLGDALLLLLLWVCVRLGQATHERIGSLAAPGRDAEAAGLTFQREMRSAARSVHDLPLVGGQVAKPFRAVAGSGQDLASAARSFQDTVAQVATFLGILVALVPALVLLALWLPRRIAWIVEATAATRLTRLGAASADLLAARALARQPLSRLARLAPDVVPGWKAGDPAATAALAQLELDELGLRSARQSTW